MLMNACPRTRASIFLAAYAGLIVIVVSAYERAPVPTTVSTASPVVVSPSSEPLPAPTTSPSSTSIAAAPVATTTTPRAASAPSTISSYQYLDCVRQRESRASYAAVNPSSRAGGAYQFLPATWDATARRAGRYDLVGVDPSQATRRDQDAMAAYLLSWLGPQPWAGPGC